jgi:predicted dehydrogenase
MMNRVKIGVVGNGEMAKRHIRALKTIKEVRILAISGRSECLLRSVASQFNIKDYYLNLDELISRTDIDAIDVVTPTYTHEEIVKKCLLAGKHVFCEKPIALELAQADRIIEAKNRSGKILMIGFPLRFSPEVMQAKQLISEGKLGNIRVAWFRYGKSLPEQLWYQDKDKSGGVTAELAVHFIDCLRWLIGSDVESVVSEASGDIYRLGKEDNIWAIYKFLNGAIGVVGSSYSFDYFDQDGGIIGDKLAIKFCRGRVIVSDYRRKKSILALAVRDYLSSLFVPFALAKDIAIINELKHFVGCVLNNKQPVITGEEARRVLELVLATTRAAKTGQRVNL